MPTTPVANTLLLLLLL